MNVGECSLKWRLYYILPLLPVGAEWASQVEDVRFVVFFATRFPSKMWIFILFGSSQLPVSISWLKILLVHSC